MNDFKQVANKITFERNENNNKPLPSTVNHPASGHPKVANSPEVLPTLNYIPQHRGTTREKLEIGRKINDDMENVKFYKKKTRSNLGLPVVEIEKEHEPEKDEKPIQTTSVATEPSKEVNQNKQPMISVNYTETVATSNEENSIKIENDIKSKTFYNNNNNIISRTKVNFDKNTQMNSTNYNSKSSRTQQMQNHVSENIRNNYNEFKYKYVKPKAPNIPQKLYKFSLERLEPDFNFKTAQLSFDPISGINRKANKYIFTPVLK